MERVNVREELEAPIGEVWELIRDFADISAWSSAQVVKTEGVGVGMMRHIEGPAGYFVERLESMDDAQYSFCYRVLQSPLSATDFLATVRLLPIALQRCTIEWCAKFEAAPESADRLRVGVEAAYRGKFIGQLRATLNAA